MGADAGARFIRIRLLAAAADGFRIGFSAHHRARAQVIAFGGFYYVYIMLGKVIEFMMLAVGII